MIVATEEFCVCLLQMLSCSLFGAVASSPHPCICFCGCFSVCLCLSECLSILLTFWVCVCVPLSLFL